MNAKARIQRLENARPANGEKDNRDFVQMITLGDVIYKIDGVEVDAVTWARECKAYDQSHAGEDQRIQVSIIGFDAIEEDADGVK
jgi:hypothetical protein